MFLRLFLEVKDLVRPSNIVPMLVGLDVGVKNSSIPKALTLYDVPLSEGY